MARRIPLEAATHALKDHSIPPPEWLRGAITARVIPGRRSIRMLLPYAVASCVILLAAAIFIFRPTAGGRVGLTKNKTDAAKLQPATLHPTDGSPAADSLSSPVPAKVADAASTASVSPLSLSMAVGGEEYPLTDNSLLATFTNYHYPQLRNFLTENKKEQSRKIRLDQYTNISLSGLMVAALKDLYDLRPDGSPTRKAKKTRQRLEKWNEEDKSQFDLRYNSNPLDPIDLAEFLFPPWLSFNRHPGRSPIPTTGSQSPILPSGSQSSIASTGFRVPDSAGLGGSRSTKNSPLTVAYSLTVLAKKNNTGIAEAYNGGIQTLFSTDNQARLRLSSLMRIQSILLTRNTKTITLLTESAKPQQKSILSQGQWFAYNNKYANARYALSEDTLRVLGYPCRKALVTLNGGRRITAWYTPEIQNSAQALLEPAFTGVPGLVLRYEYTSHRKTIQYTATSLSRQPIAPSVFALPVTP